MKFKWTPISIAIVLSVLVGCSDDDAEPIRAELSVADQSPEIADVVVIDRVAAPNDGFIAIVQSVNGQPSAPVIGLRDIDAGETSSVAVALERAVVDGESLYARLHADSDGDGEYEWTPSGTIDPIVVEDGAAVEAEFTVTSSRAVAPTVLADDQPIVTTGGEDTLTVKSVVTSTTGFVVIRTGVTISNTVFYGSEPITLGLNAMVPVTLTANESPAPDDVVEAVIHLDSDDDGVFDETVDEPFLLDGDRITAEFTIEAAAP